MTRKSGMKEEKWEEEEKKTSKGVDERIQSVIACRSVWWIKYNSVYMTPSQLSMRNPGNDRILAQFSLSH